LNNKQVTEPAAATSFSLEQKKASVLALAEYRRRRIKLLFIAPPTITGKSLKGNGWTLDLSPEWNIVPGVREGDYCLQMGDHPHGAKPVSDSRKD
jgi:hypothetical protein